MISLKPGMKPLALFALFTGCELLFLSGCGRSTTPPATSNEAPAGPTSNPAAKPNTPRNIFWREGMLSIAPDHPFDLPHLSFFPRRVDTPRAFFGGMGGASAGAAQRALLIFPGGTTYEGEVRDGVPDGEGTMTSLGGTHQWGQFRNGLSYKLAGIWVGPDGTREEGVWNLDGAKSGGTIKYKDGRVYKGEWKLMDGVPERPNGSGTMTWPDGRVYVGEFRDGWMDGPGKMTYPDGKAEDGNWKAGQFVHAGS
ncbi:MAG TPA: hypothetical protein VMV72_10110 [Verrucomicrobiae bacterium]|nr:hypothetical protein [Verrucomicrobiae bacterium]